jgi:hypothetical protein
MDELYDLESDPFEMTNLINEAAFSELLTDLRRQIIKHLESSSEVDVRLKNVFLLALKNGL